ncbi:MAG: NAD(P)H-hydrate dehydratase [Planctomycetia bacterium]|nr:NAD(P)H-hydrate dehydratase [Planctomycetia bacterium]
MREIRQLHEKLLCREKDSHKGTYGTVLLVAGSIGASGAAVLAGRAALRGGAGLTRVAVPMKIQAVVAQMQAEYTTIPLAEDKRGRISESAGEQILLEAEKATVVAVGPGLSRSKSLVKLVRRLWKEVPRPMILDADGLNALAEWIMSDEEKRESDFPRKTQDVRIITPHPGEFSRLSGVSAKDLEAQRAAAVEWARKHQCVVVLKGTGTFVTDGVLSWRNTTGNPGMATGGSGDVLTGMMAAFAAQLLSQGVSGMDVARLAVYLHGKAGDLAVKETGEVSLIAGDILRFLPQAVKNISFSCD